MEDLINIKNDKSKCFLWCSIRHLNPSSKDPQRIIKVDKKLVKDLNYKDIDFSLSKNDYGKIEERNNISVNIFFYENGLVFHVHISKQKFDDHIDLLLINDENKSHYVYIKDFNRYMFNKKKDKNKKTLLQMLFTMF